MRHKLVFRFFGFFTDVNGSSFALNKTTGLHLGLVKAPSLFKVLLGCLITGVGSLEQVKTRS